MKTLANCTPKEFLIQTNKIRKSAAKWLDLTRILEIRKEKPDIGEKASDGEKKAALEKQVRRNLSCMLDKILEEYPEETAELLGMMCFIEPEDIEKHTMGEILENISELISSKEVMSFFISLVQLENNGILSIV